MKRLFCVLVMTIAPTMLRAHEVPTRVNISLFVKQESNQLTILARVPANALIDTLLPTSEANWVDIQTAKSEAQIGAEVWIADLLSFSEEESLPRPKIQALRLSRTKDPAFANYDDAYGRITGPPLPAETLARQEDLTVDVILTTPLNPAHSSPLFFEPRFSRLGVTVGTSLTYLPSSGASRIYIYEGDPEAFALNPGRVATLARFVEEGVTHFLSQTDYLLLVLCIALVFQNLKTLFPFVALLAAAQAMTLFVALGAMSTEFWLRGVCGTALVGAVVYMGCEAIVAAPSPRVVLAVVVGTVVGYGCWLGLQPTVQFGGAHLATAGVGFIVGAIVAEIIALMMGTGMVYLFHKLSSAPHRLVMVVAAFAIHIAWRRFLDRADALALMPTELRGIETTILMYAGAGLVLLFAAHALVARGKRALTRR